MDLLHRASPLFNSSPVMFLRKSLSQTRWAIVAIAPVDLTRVVSVQVHEVSLLPNCIQAIDDSVKRPKGIHWYRKLKWCRKKALLLRHDNIIIRCCLITIRRQISHLHPNNTTRLGECKGTHDHCCRRTWRYWSWSLELPPNPKCTLCPSMKSLLDFYNNPSPLKDSAIRSVILKRSETSC